MLEYILGVLTGVVVMGFLLTQRTPVERTFRQLSSKIQKKGVIIEPDNSDLASWLDGLKDDENLPRM